MIEGVLRPLPYQAADRLVRVDESARKRMLSGVPPRDYMRGRGRADLFEKTVSYVKDTVTLSGTGSPDQAPPDQAPADQIVALRTGGRAVPAPGRPGAVGPHACRSRR